MTKSSRKQSTVRRAKPSAATRQAAIDRVYAGESARMVASSYDLNPGTVYRWLKQAGPRPALVATLASPTTDPSKRLALAPTDAEVALGQALDEIRDMSQVIGRLYLAQLRLTDGDRRPVDRTLLG